MKTILIHREYYSTRNLALAHLLINPAKGGKKLKSKKYRATLNDARCDFRQLPHLVVALHRSRCGNIDSLNRVLAVADIRAMDSDALEHNEENGRIKLSFSWQPNSH